MSTSTQSLYNFLGRQNPPLDMSHCTPGKNTTSGHSSWKFPRMVKTWDDFEFESLNMIYGGILRETLEVPFVNEQSWVPEDTCCQIHDEKSFEALVILWNRSIVSMALGTANQYLEGRLPLDKIYIGLGGQAKLPSSGRQPDWAGIKPSTVRTDVPMAKSENFLPGDTKTSLKFSSNMIVCGELSRSQRKSNSVQPLGQIYTYCVNANARYGYIITDEELIVFRIRPTSQADRDTLELKDLTSLKAMDREANVEKLEAMQLTDKAPAKRAMSDGTLEYKAVPWAEHLNGSNGDREVMTVNLALWWLHMMATESSSIEEQYPPLRDAAWNARPQTQPSQRASSASLNKPKAKQSSAKKTHDRRLNTSSNDPKRGHDMRLRERAKATDYPKQASQQKRRTRRH